MQQPKRNSGTASSMSSQLTPAKLTKVFYMRISQLPKAPSVPLTSTFRTLLDLLIYCASHDLNNLI